MDIMNFGYFMYRFDRGCNIDPNKEALVFQDERLTYGELNLRVKKLAGALQNIGLKKGDRVGILLKNCIEWFELIFAIAKLGAVFVPINWMFRPAEAEFIIDDSGASILAVGDDLVDIITPIISKLSNVKEVICVEKFGGERPKEFLSYSKLPFRETDIIERPRLDDIYLLQYTSGTTGTPKGATHTHGTLLWNLLYQIFDFDMRANSCTLTIPSLCWAAGLHDMTLASLWIGGKVILMPSGNIEIRTILEMIQREKVTNTVLVPTILRKLVDFPEAKKFDLTSLGFVVTGGEPVPVTLLSRLYEMLPGAPILQGFGLSEGPTIATILAKDEGLTKIGSAGHAVSNCEVSIVDDEMNHLTSNVEGEIVLRSPATMVGYWNRPKENEEAFRGGWFHTGDSGKLDENGYVYVTGRKKDMIISGGLNVYPAEIENVILKDERVEEVAVIGVADEKWGEIGKAIIKLKSGQRMTEQEVIELCNKNLAKFKVPKKAKFIEEPLPRTLSGKIKKFELRESEKKS